MNAIAAPSVSTTCPYCGVGCGVLARPDGNGGAMMAGDPDHPANLGRLCSKGFALGDTLGLEQRLLHPMRRDSTGALTRTDWSTALDAVAQGFADTIARHGPDAVAFYLSGQLLTEDYYVANKLMKGFVGSANVDTNSRLCMASTVAGHKRAFGADIVPGSYEDIDAADLIVLTGSNAAWCHPVLFARMVRARSEHGTKIVSIDPRRTVTAADSDLFLPLAPGSDAALFAGLLVHLAETQSLDRAFIGAHTSGFDETLASARALAPDIAATATACGLDPSDVENFFDLFRTTERVVTCFSQGVNQSAQGSDKVNAIINCHLASGRIGRPGMGPLSLTGQPNAMGGREVGGLANQLAAHMGFAADDIDRVRRFWKAPRMAAHEGLKAVDMFDAIARGDIKALWVMGTNPAVSLPRAGAMRDALGRLELFVVSDVVRSNDTLNAGANIVLPAAAWGEKDGTVTNSDRTISRQRAFLPLPGEVRPDWLMVAEVARRLGHADAFAYRSAADIFREHAALSCFENEGARGFDIGALASLSDLAYATLAPTQWPMRAGENPTKRLFAAGGFFTADHKARFVAPQPPALREATSPEFPLRLNTGRVRDQWHTMTRTGLSAALGAHCPEPFVEIHPLDAAAHGLKHDGYAQISTRHGACVLKVAVVAGARRGSIFAPIHWSGETASAARIGDLVAAVTDPVSGQPEAKATPAAVAPVNFAYRGIAFAQTRPEFPPATWWVRVATADAQGDGAGFLIATNDGPAAWRDLAPRMFGPHAVLTEYVDRQRGLYRAAAFVDGRLAGALFLAPEGTPVPWDLRAGPRAGLGELPVVCACFGVSLAAIRGAIATRANMRAEDIGVALRAGTKCGSCLPELRSLVNHGHHEHAHTG